MNYLLTGGEFNNKGAEGMTLVAISNIVKFDPSAKIYLLSKHTKNPFVFKCDFNILDCPQYVLHRIAKRKVGFIRYVKEFLKIFIPGKQSGLGQKRKVEKVLKSIDVMIDVSGYQLSSKWSNDTNIDYCCWINIMHSFGCKIYLMPQSFGPFDYKNKSVLQLIESTLKKCTKIYAREDSGYTLLKECGLNNVVKCPDSVLIENNLPLKNIISNYEIFTGDYEILGKNNIAIVPNKRLIDKGGYNHDKLISFYSRIISKFKDTDFYLVPHAGEDIEICRKIKEKNVNEGRIHFIDHVFCSFEYQRLAKKMDFIIASRYHSIIHAYKECTPAIILGWSDKYEDIADIFEQREYIILDIDDFDTSVKKIDLMKKSYLKEKNIIKKHLEEVQMCNNCYSFLGELNGNK